VDEGQGPRRQRRGVQPALDRLEPPVRAGRLAHLGDHPADQPRPQRRGHVIARGQGHALGRLVVERLGHRQGQKNRGDPHRRSPRDARGATTAPMKLFLDTADTAVIGELAATGLVDGVTTNPSLIAKSGRNIAEVIAEICALVEGPISAEVAAVEFDAMIAEGDKLAAIAPNVVVKVPLTWDGLKATAAFAAKGVRTNVTLCFSAAQALLA